MTRQLTNNEIIYMDDNCIYLRVNETYIDIYKETDEFNYYTLDKNLFKQYFIKRIGNEEKGFKLIASDKQPINYTIKEYYDTTIHIIIKNKINNIII